MSSKHLSYQKKKNQRNSQTNYKILIPISRFLLQSLVRPLTIGITQMFSDYFCKPCLAVLFNGIVQPPLIFLYNIAVSVRDICDPVAQSIGYYLREVAVLCRSFRLVDVKTNRKCDCNDLCNENEESKAQCEEQLEKGPS